MEIIPSQPYTLSFFITDHTDSATYYCRAVVYDTTTGAVLETVNLDQTSGNTRLFSKRTQAPGDTSGKGRKITVVATAYSDSGYTTKSALYQEQSENYVVVKRNDTTGGGGYGIDYRTIREMMQEELAKVKKPKEVVIPAYPEAPTMRWEDILEAIGKIPKQEKTDLSGVIEAIKAVGVEVQAIVIPEQKETDLTELHEHLDAIDASIGEVKDTVVSSKGELEALFKESVVDSSSREDQFEEIAKIILNGKKPSIKTTPKESVPAFNINKLIGAE